MVTVKRHDKMQNGMQMGMSPAPQQDGFQAQQSKPASVQQQGSSTKPVQPGAKITDWASI